MHKGKITESYKKENYTKLAKLIRAGKTTNRGNLSQLYIAFFLQ